MDWYDSLTHFMRFESLTDLEDNDSLFKKTPLRSGYMTMKHIATMHNDLNEIENNDSAYTDISISSKDRRHMNKHVLPHLQRAKHTEHFEEYYFNRHRMFKQIDKYEAREIVKARQQTPPSSPTESVSPERGSFRR
jgi:hypothetical protein